MSDSFDNFDVNAAFDQLAKEIDASLTSTIDEIWKDQFDSTKTRLSASISLIRADRMLKELSGEYSASKSFSILASTLFSTHPGVREMTLTQQAELMNIYTMLAMAMMAVANPDALS